MEFIDLASQQKRIRTVIESRIQALLDHGKYIMGPEVKELEGQLAAFTGAKHCISCASGTDALLMALMAHEINTGDAVFVPAFTFFATAEMPALLGSTVVFVDIDPSTFTMCPNQLKKAILAVIHQDPSIYPLPVTALETKLTPRVVIPVDLFGQPADYTRILTIAKQFNLYSIEDAAQSFGATYKDQSTCNLGCDCAITSFFPAKPLGCYGDGGAIFTNDDKLAATLKSIRVHGKGRHKYENVRIGINGRLDTLQAAILLAKLDLFPNELCTRQNVAAWYMEGLAGIKNVTLPHITPGNFSVFAQFSIRIGSDMRDIAAIYLAEKDIPTNIYYPKPLHIQTVFADQYYEAEDMPISTACSHEILSLPFHPYMAKDDVTIVCNTLIEVLS